MAPGTEGRTAGGSRGGSESLRGPGPRSGPGARDRSGPRGGFGARDDRADTLDPRRVVEVVRAQREAWVAYLRRLASVESPTGHSAGQRSVQSILAEDLRDLGFRDVTFARSTREPALRAKPVHGVAPYQLLLGHTDTVWPLGTLGSMPVDADAGLLRGPGVFDMKAGLANIVFAFRSLRTLDAWPTVTPIVFVNSDEEAGSPGSTRHIRRIAARTSRAFVVEPGLGPNGRLKTTRKGSARYTIQIRGRAAHAGLEPERGVSAIEEAARLVRELHGLGRPADGVHVNVGRIGGGVAANVVAPDAWIELDVRFATAEQGRDLDHRVRSLRPARDECIVEVRSGIDRPPMEPTPANRRLWNRASEVGCSMDLDLDEAAAGGGSDGCTTSAVVATLDGLGAVGGGAHARDEHVHIDRTLERCALLACLLMLPE